VVSAGYGIFYDRYVLSYLGRAFDKNGLHAFEQVANGPAAAALFQGAAGGSLLTPAAGIAPSIFRADPSLPTSYSEQASLGLQYLVEKNTTFEATYHFTRGVKLSRTRNINLAPPVTLTLANAASLGFTAPTAQQIGQPVFSGARLGPTYDNIYQLENAAGSTYHGLSISLNRKLTELNFSANYTISKTLDDASDFDEQPQNPYAVWAEKALSRNDQRHRFTLTALWEVKFGTEGWKKVVGKLELAPILTIGSGRPVDPLVGVDANHSGAWPFDVRPVGLARNSLKTPTVANVDFRISKQISVPEHGHVSLMVDFFNMLNRRNITQLNQFYGAGAIGLSGFATPLGPQRPRENQFAVEWEF